MSLIAAATGAVERLPLPDLVTRAGIAFLVNRTGRKLDRATAQDERNFLAAMDDLPIAIHADAANAQHYEVPAEFFARVLGPRRKYSCCLYGNGAETLAAAEEQALDQTIAHADLADGQHILELGCGWGSLSLAMAARFPRARITSLSNSHSQREYITARAGALGLDNLAVLTSDITDFHTDARFDRVVSVEMWEHLSNWRALLARVRGWLHPDGSLFLHVFSHRNAPYRFDHQDKSDWIARHFFTGGIMPSHGLIRHLDQHFTLAEDWRWSGRNYQRTAEDWLANFDANEAEILVLFRRVYGGAAALWLRRWRLFFLATAGLFGAENGSAWGVSHYRLLPR